MLALAVVGAVRYGNAEEAFSPTQVQPQQLVEQSPCAINILMVRHCDKRPAWMKDPTPDGICTARGLLRGEHVAHAFGPAGRFPEPTRLFARRLPTGTYNSRDLYLLWPLARRLHLHINTSFSQEKTPDLGLALLAERDVMCASSRDKEPTVLISWQHCSIPALAQTLGCTWGRCMTCWDDADFDSVLWLRFLQGPATDWQLEMKVDSEHFHGPKGKLGYRECAGASSDSAVFGLPCVQEEELSH